MGQMAFVNVRPSEELVLKSNFHSVRRVFDFARLNISTK